MNKSEFVKSISEKTGLSLKTSRRGLDTTLEVIRDSLKKGHKLTLIGFGIFSTNIRKERMARNIQTGKPIKVKAKRVVKFKAGKALSEIVRKSK